MGRKAAARARARAAIHPALPSVWVVTVHEELYKNVLRLREHLKEEEERYQGRVNALRPTAGAMARALAFNWDGQLYSRAVQIFSALTVEASLNTYGLLRMPATAFESYYEHLGLVAKLRELLEDCVGIKMQEGDELYELTARLSQRRNGFVHPKSLVRPLSQFVGGSPGPPATAAAAEEAYRDMLRFFELFPSLDRSTRTIFFLF